MIETRQLVKQYNGTTVLNLPNLKIERGDSLGLVGNNGAGKTTFFSLLLDLIIASEGEILIEEKVVHKSDHWKQKTGAYLDENFLIDFLRPDEYFQFIAQLHHIPTQDLDLFNESMQDFFSGEILGNKKLIRDLSKGNQKKVGIAAALLAKPDILILDEPFPHLDPSSVIRLKNLLKEIKKETTLLLSSHDLNHVTDVCDRIVVLDHGDVVHDIIEDQDALQKLESYFAV